MNDTPNPLNDDAAKLATIDEAFQTMHPMLESELRASQSHGLTSTLDNYLIDYRFDADIRNMLIFLHDDDFDLRTFIADDCESDRFYDLIRAHAMISLMTRDELSQLLMRYSLCPLHAIDWAICFDDDTNECAAIRRIFPRSHDT